MLFKYIYLLMALSISTAFSYESALADIRGRIVYEKATIEFSSFREYAIRKEVHGYIGDTAVKYPIDKFQKWEFPERANGGRDFNNLFRVSGCGGSSAELDAKVTTFDGREFLIEDVYVILKKRRGCAQRYIITVKDPITGELIENTFDNDFKHYKYGKIIYLEFFSKSSKSEYEGLLEATTSFLKLRGFSAEASSLSFVKDLAEITIEVSKSDYEGASLKIRDALIGNIPVGGGVLDAFASPEVDENGKLVVKVRLPLPVLSKVANRVGISRQISGDKQL